MLISTYTCIVDTEWLTRLIRLHRMGELSDAEFAQAVRASSDRQLAVRSDVILRDSTRLHNAQANLHASSNATGTEFLRTEIALGITFSEIALGSGTDAEKYRRNQVNAQAAYDAVLRFRERVELTETDAAQIDVNMEHLRSNLARLSEPL